jgi:hypothetical protein
MGCDPPPADLKIAINIIKTLFLIVFFLLHFRLLISFRYVSERSHSSFLRYFFLPRTICQRYLEFMLLIAGSHISGNHVSVFVLLNNVIVHIN